MNKPTDRRSRGRLVRTSTPRSGAMTIPAVAAVMTVVIATTAPAEIFDLTVDFSYAANPNGAWAYSRGPVLLGYTPTPLPGPPAPCSTDGYWGSAWEAIVFRATVDSSQTPGYGADDWVEGDVISYTPDSGANVRYTWTAPGDGTITYSGSTWYASTIVARSNIFTLALNGGASLATGEVNSSTTRSSAITFASKAPIAVIKGDVLELAYVKNAGQCCGSFSGSALKIKFETLDRNTPDLDGDGAVGGADIAIVLGSWGPCAACPADLNDDGVVDGGDITILLGRWTG